MPRANPPPGIEQQTWDDLKGGIFSMRRSIRAEMFSALCMMGASLLSVIIYKRLQARLDFDMPAAWAALWALCFIFLLCAIAARPHVDVCREAITALAPHIDQTTVYRIHFHTTRKLCFVVGVLTFTRKTYSEPAVVV